MKMTADELRQNRHWLQTVAKGIEAGPYRAEGSRTGFASIFPVVSLPTRYRRYESSLPPAPPPRRHTLVH